jgi:hypothetical protein
MKPDNNSELPQTIAAALACGSKRFFDGSPCKHGHVVPRRVYNSNCTECDRLFCKARRKRIKESMRTVSERAPINLGDRIAAALYPDNSTSETDQT